MSVLAAFSVTPLGAESGDGSVGAAVAEAVRIVRASGLPNETNAMFTNLEGEWDEVMAVVKACVERLAESAPRVSVVVKLDVRPGAGGAIRSKVASVERHLDTSSPARPPEAEPDLERAATRAGGSPSAESRARTSARQATSSARAGGAAPSSPAAQGGTQAIPPAHSSLHAARALAGRPGGSERNRRAETVCSPTASVGR